MRHLDSEQSWIILDDFNVFTWPGFDLRPIPQSDRYDHGFLPPKLFKQIIGKFVELREKRLPKETSRDDPADTDNLR